MGYYVSTMIGVRTGGVFSADVDVEDIKRRIQPYIDNHKEKDGATWSTPGLDHCLSSELVSTKGGYVVMAGVFNYWSYDCSSVFAQDLSKEFGTEVMIMSWDEERDVIQCNVFLDGRQLFEVNENPIGQVLRRVC